MDDARHLTGASHYARHLTHRMSSNSCNKVSNAFDDVASTIYPSLPSGEGGGLSRKQKKKAAQMGMTPEVVLSKQLSPVHTSSFTS